MNRREIILSGLLAGFAVAVSVPAAAQDTFPNREITFIVPWAAGGGSDAIARALAPGLEEALGKSVVIQNVPGAGGVVGWKQLSNAEPDGHTISIVTSSILVTKHLNAAEGVDFRDFSMISHVADSPLVMLANPTGPYKTLDDILQEAREKPGQIRMATAGVGTMWHIGGLGLGVASGDEFTFIPFKGGNEAMPAIMGGIVEGGAGTLTESASFVTEGKLAALAVFSDERNPLIPDVPTLKESGVDYKFEAWWGIMAPKGTPPEIVAKLHGALSSAIQAEKFQTYAKHTALTVVDADGTELAKRAESEDADFLSLLQKAGVN
jgi:tripartite-type tricarboxylate transporter receptor subunit TctC